MSQKSEDIEFWHPRLEADERLAWVGRPGWTFVPDSRAVAICILLGLPALAILIVGHRFEALAAESLHTLRLFAGGVLIWLVAYLYARAIVTPLFTRYALTDRRALVWTAYPWPRLRSQPLDGAAPVAWDGKTEGSIYFADAGAMAGAQDVPEGTIRTGGRRLGFLRIPDAAQVHETILKLAGERAT